jgi:hypothetical protein
MAQGLPDSGPSEHTQHGIPRRNTFGVRSEWIYTKNNSLEKTL